MAGVLQSGIFLRTSTSQPITYRISFDYTSEGDVLLRLGLNDANSDSFGGDSSLPPSPEWHRFSRTFTLPVQAEAFIRDFRVVFITRSAVVHVDNVLVEKIAGAPDPLPAITPDVCPSGKMRYTPVATGPISISQNIFLTDDNATYENPPPEMVTGLYFYSGHEATAFIQNNLFIGFQGFVFGPTNDELGAPSTYFINNLFTSKYYTPNTALNIWPAIKVRQPYFDGNWIGGLRDTRENFRRADGSLKPISSPESFLHFGDHNTDVRPKRLWGSFTEPNEPREDAALSFCTPASESADMTGRAVDLSSGATLEFTDNDGIRRTRTIPHMFAPDGGSPYIGAFRPGDTKCNGLQWLLGDDR